MNKLKLDSEKIDLLPVCQKIDQGAGIQLMLDLSISKTQMHTFGALLDSFLSLDTQVLAVAKHTFAQLKLVRQLSPLSEKSDLATATHVLVLSPTKHLMWGCLWKVFRHFSSSKML